MDALAKIERTYGCVAEYNRCMEEEENNRYWNSLSAKKQQQIIAEQNKIQAQYQAELQLLKLPVHPIVAKLKKEFATAKQKLQEKNLSDMARYYANQELYAQWLVSTIQKISSLHNVELQEQPNREYQRGKFAIRIEYIDGCNYKHIYIEDLNTEKFLEVYNDIYAIASCQVSMTYRDTRQHKGYWAYQDSLHTLTGVSTEELRRNEFPRLGIIDNKAKTLLANK